MVSIRLWSWTEWHRSELANTTCCNRRGFGRIYMQVFTMNVNFESAPCDISCSNSTNK